MAINFGQGTPEAPSKGYKLYITALVMVLVASCFVLARFVTRISRKKTGLDDYLILVALISSVFLTLSINLAVVNGYGTSGFFVAQIIYKVVLGFTKVSILVLYRRIFIGVNFRRVVNVLIALIIIWATMATVATIFQCTPIAASWDNSIPVSKCIHKNAFWYGFAVTNTFSDFVLLFLPVQPILKLRLDWRSKLAVLGVFALGAFVCIAGVIRTTAVAQTTTGPKKDITWDFIPRSVWTLIEANTGIICACLPILKGALARLFPSFFRTGSSDDKRYTRSGQNSYSFHMPSYLTPAQRSAERSITIEAMNKQKDGDDHRRESEEYIMDRRDGPDSVELQPSGIVRKMDCDITYDTESSSVDHGREQRHH